MKVARHYVRSWCARAANATIYALFRHCPRQLALMFGTPLCSPAWVSRRFFVDFIASIPFERLAGGGDETLVLALAKMPRLLRLSRLLKKLDMFTSAREIRVFSVLIVFVVFTHFVGCFWWLVGKSQKSNGWQFQPNTVPLLLQDIDWSGEQAPASDARLLTPPPTASRVHTPSPTPTPRRRASHTRASALRCNAPP